MEASTLNNMRAPTLDTCGDAARWYPTNSAGVVHFCALEVVSTHERCADVDNGHCTVPDGLLLRQIGEEWLAGGVGVCTALKRHENVWNCFESRPITINNTIVMLNKQYRLSLLWWLGADWFYCLNRAWPGRIQSAIPTASRASKRQLA